MTQQEIKFERFGRKEQLDALDALTLPNYGGVSGVTLKSVLRSIESHARGEGESWATQETIQREVNCKNIRTVKRAVAALIELNLITNERRCLGFSRLVNHHTIVWQQVVEAVNRGRNVTFIGDKKSPSLVTSSTETGGEKSPSMVTGCHLHKKRKIKRKEPPPPNDARETRANSEEEEVDFYQEQDHPMAKRTTTRKPPEHRPILEADYNAAPLEHRTRTVVAGSAEDRAAEREVEDRRRDVPGWPAFEQDRVRDMFAAAGVARAHDLMRTAIARGITPEDCDAHVETMHNSVDAKTRQPLGAGALWDRITQGGWIKHIAKADLDKPNAVEPPDLADERRQAARRAEFERLEALAKADRARRNERDERLGKILDALPEEQLVALLARVPAFWHDGVNRRFTGERPIKFGMLRDDLFSLLESEATR